MRNCIILTIAFCPKFSVEEEAKYPRLFIGSDQGKNGEI